MSAQPARYRGHVDRRAACRRGSPDRRASRTSRAWWIAGSCQAPVIAREVDGRRQGTYQGVAPTVKAMVVLLDRLVRIAAPFVGVLVTLELSDGVDARRVDRQPGEG